MTLEELHEKARLWDLQSSGTQIAPARYQELIDELSYHSSRQFRIYLPSEHPDENPNYMERLAQWVGNVSDEADQKLLLEYALRISFCSHEDFIAIYRSAFNTEITKWVAQQVEATLNGVPFSDFMANVRHQLMLRTWFCPVTDSMDINEFYKVNHLTGIGHRPGFSTLHMLAEKAAAPDPSIASNLLHYMSNPSLDQHHPRPSIERVVLLEDIVGSANQCIDAVRWAVANIPKPILFVPLVLCPNGAEKLRLLAQGSNGRLTVMPVVELRREEMLGSERRNETGWEFAPMMEVLATQCASDASPQLNTFGYEGTGCSIATFANTPNNSLPLIHNRPSTKSWNPLFPRVFRD